MQDKVGHGLMMLKYQSFDWSRVYTHTHTQHCYGASPREMAKQSDLTDWCRTPDPQKLASNVFGNWRRESGDGSPLTGKRLIQDPPLLEMGSPSPPCGLGYHAGTQRWVAFC